MNNLMFLYSEIISFLERKFEKKIYSIMQVDKIDLDMINHLTG